MIWRGCSVLFNSIDFFWFFLVVLIGFYLLPNGLKRHWLLAASYYFYGNWNLQFLILLLGLTALDYGAGLLVARSGSKVVLAMSVAANLSVLCFFKFLSVPLDLWMPIGISFHIFQSISYVVDVYRKEQEPVRNPLDYALFLAFFPQLVAGPIVRAKQFFADLDPWVKPSQEEVARGAWLLVLGLVKKMVFADQFAKLSDAYFGGLSSQPGILNAWSGVLAFSLQIFFDFSGYTDMAIGMAKLLGFHFPVNFRRPYLAGSVTEFWRRWHISLSSWLRDYLYIPMGGNRKGKLRTYGNLMLTMLLGGLWHGGSWNFLIWGGCHGALLAIERWLGMEKSRWWRMPLTFLLVTHVWVFFRATSFHDAVYVLEHLWRGPLGAVTWNGWQLGLGLSSIIIACLEEWLEIEDRLVSGGVMAYGVAMALLLIVLEVFAVTDLEIPFLYFQF
jgi:alginate O-acetyltransferase complex protein AlgI